MKQIQYSVVSTVRHDLSMSKPYFSPRTSWHIMTSVSQQTGDSLYMFILRSITRDVKILSVHYRRIQIETRCVHFGKIPFTEDLVCVLEVCGSSTCQMAMLCKTFRPGKPNYLRSVKSYMGVSKNRGIYPKMDGL